MRHSLRRINVIRIGVFLAPFLLYVGTLAPTVVPGDPGEYQFIPHILGIAHPPGYAFFTLLAKTWTTFVRIGSIAYRTNLLAAAAGAWTVLMAHESVWVLGFPPTTTPAGNTQRADCYTNSFSQAGRLRTASAQVVPALFTALVLATSTDFWQHSIHANSHIVSAALSATAIYTGLRWWASNRDGWLYAFSFLAALGVTHHPLLAFSVPAYVTFVLLVCPRIFSYGRRIAAVALAVLLGLSVFLYLPLRAGATPFGPSPTLEAIVGHATARGIRGNLFYFGFADQPVRIRVFWGLLRLQFSVLTLFLAVVGVIWLARRRPRPFALLILFYLVNVAFTINTVQDVMAYLLLPFTATAVLAGAGVSALLEIFPRLVQGRGRQMIGLICLGSVLAAGPLTSALHQAPRLSLRDYRAAEEYTEAVFARFAGKKERAVLLAPWEGMTPLHYAAQVEGRQLDPSDAKLVYVASGTANPWVEFVWKHIEDGPIYLTDYRPQVVAEGFRLLPVGDWPLYRVVAPHADGTPEDNNSIDLWAGGKVHLLGWGLDRTSLRAGETSYLTLHMSAPEALTDYYLPYLRLGDRLYRWTTDSRLNTPWWQPNETVVERFPVTIPFGTPPGDYALALGFTNVSKGEDLPLSNGETSVMLSSSIHVESPRIQPPSDILAQSLANIASRISLLGGRIEAEEEAMAIPWAEPIQVHPGDEVQVWLNWRALTAVDHPYTVFVHLIDSAGRLWSQHDYTPMGGAFPTFLWIPRWIEGQSISDPYRLQIPSDAPAGDYLIEVGMYETTSLRRAYHFDQRGNLAGDRYILGSVNVSARE